MIRNSSSITGLLVTLGLCTVQAEEPSSALNIGRPAIQNDLLAARSLLRSGQVRHASQRAAAAYDLSPHRAEIQTLLGDIAYRKADFEKALSFYQSALDLDPAYARAYLGMGQMEQLNFRRKSAVDYLARAYRLDPRDPEIIRVYAASVADRETELALLKEYVALGMAEGQQQFDSVAGELRIHQQLGGRPMEKLATPYRRYNLHLTSFYPGGGPAGGLLLKVSLNGCKPLRLVLDTGAHGIVIGKKQSERLGLETLTASYVRGVGSSSGTTGTLTLARTVQIDDLVILNGMVEVTDRPLVDEADGVIGISLFQQFLLKLDFFQKWLELVPFPDGSVSNTGGDTAWRNWNRQPSVAAEGFIPLHKIGHLLLMKATVNRKSQGYFLLDTGAAVTSVAQQTVMVENRRHVEHFQGASGVLGNPIRISPVELEFSGKSFTEPNVIAFDHEPMSNQIGIEVSGLIGYPSISRSAVTTINYRDGLIQFSMRR